MENKEVQKIAKDTIKYIRNIIKPGMNLIDVRKLCEDKMLELGADSFWYWNVGAFIFSGDETTISISGKRYQTSNKIIQENDIITIDLSPQNHNIWGDFARTIVIENGLVINNIDDIQNNEWKKSLKIEEILHCELLKFVTVDTTFEELYYHMNSLIKRHGFINLDFLGNLGHSIVTKNEDRIYIEKGNHQKLSNVNYFTFEPHISIPNSLYGYKKENIYYFDENKLKIL
jgi:methionine aminopeptidase